MSASLSVFATPHGETEILAAYQAVLNQWPVPYTEQYIPTHFGETHVIVSGPQDAPPLVFLHALFATATVWYPNVGSLSRHYRVYAIDVIGEANKSRPTRRISHLDEFAQWFEEFLVGVGIQQTYLVGNSYGGFLSALFAMRLPERIRRMVLISPAATFHQIMPFYLHIFVPKMLYMFFPKMPGMAKLVHDSINWIRNGLLPDPVWEQLFYRALLYGGMTSQIFPKVYSLEELRQIKTPTLLLIGDREKIYRPQDAIRSAEKAVPTLRAEIIPNAHHIAALAQPEIVNQRIEQFFAEGKF